MKKEKEVNIGVFGDAIDYHVYYMSFGDKLVGFLLGALIAGAVLQIFFGILILSAIGCVLGGLAGIKIYCGVLKRKRDRNLKIQFRDMLESLSTSLGSGKNVKDSFEETYSDLCSQYGDSSLIARECYLINTGIANGVNIETMLSDFAKRSNNEDIESFSEIFEVANRAGGNIKNIVYETKNMISDRLDVELELETMVSGKKNELNIMIIMPLIVVTMIKGLGTSGTAMTVFASKLIALCIFVAAYALGKKMTDIKV